MRADLPAGTNVVAKDVQESETGEKSTMEEVKKVTVESKANGSALSLLSSPAYPEISNEMVNESFRKAFFALRKDENYKRYLDKYPDTFKTYRARLMYSPQYGWEWKLEFYPDLGNNPENIDKASTINFAISVENNKVTVVGKHNID